MRALAILAAFLLAVAPAAAQVKLKGGDKLQQDEADPDRQLAEFNRLLMSRTLPFKDGQTLRYYNGEGKLEGFARRKQLTIRFYEPDGSYVGRAERVSQAATVYYDKDGRYLGRRLHKKQTTNARAAAPEGKGFSADKVPGQPEQD